MDLTLTDLTEPQILVGTVQLTLQEEHVDRFKNSKSLNKGVDPARFGDIRQWLGKGGKVSVATAGTKSIKLKGDKLNEYVLLPLICTFAPDAGTNFTEAQLDFVLETPQDVPAAAIADEMFPLEIEQECRVEKHLKIEPNFSFSKVKVKLGSIGDKEKYILYEPHITALH